MHLLTVAHVLDDEKLKEARQALGGLTWKDGRETAGARARRVKENEQADLSRGDGPALRQLLAQAVESHPVVRAFALPRRLSKIMVSRTSGGGRYGPHVDNALMGSGGARMRSDLSFTLFLSAPETYEGGMLTMHNSAGAQEVKLPAGDLVLYPSTEIHEVTPVTSGERIVAVGWIESLISDPEARAALFDLENLRVSLREKMPAEAEELLVLDRTMANLMRRWAKP